MYNPIHAADPFGKAYHVKHPQRFAKAKKNALPSPIDQLPKYSAAHQGIAPRAIYQVKKADQKNTALFITELLQKQLEYGDEIKALISQNSPIAQKKLAELSQEMSLMPQQIAEIDTYFLKNQRTLPSKETINMLALLLEVICENQALINLNSTYAYAQKLIDSALKQQIAIKNLVVSSQHQTLVASMAQDLKAMIVQTEEIQHLISALDKNSPNTSTCLLRCIIDYNLSRIEEFKTTLAKPVLVAAPKVGLPLDKNISVLQAQPFDVLAPPTGFIVQRALKNLSLPNADLQDAVDLPRINHTIFNDAMDLGVVEPFDIEMADNFAAVNPKELTAEEELAQMMAELSLADTEEFSAVDLDGDSFMEDSFACIDENDFSDSDVSALPDIFHNSIGIDQETVAREQLHSQANQIAMRAIHVMHNNQAGALLQLDALQAEIETLKTEWENLNLHHRVRYPSAMAQTLRTTLEIMEDFCKLQAKPLNSADQRELTAEEELAKMMNTLQEFDDYSEESSLMDISDDESLENVAALRKPQPCQLNAEDAARKALQAHLNQQVNQAIQIMQSDSPAWQLDDVEEAIAALKNEWELLNPHHRVRYPSTMAETLRTIAELMKDFRAI